MRDDFKRTVKEEVAKRVGYLCSKPDCQALTSGPQANNGSTSVGVAAHITAASKNGPRYDEKLTAAQRSSEKNAIWLCQTHAKLIDSDKVMFNAELLHSWKTLAEAHAAHNIGKPRQDRDAANDLRLFQLSVDAYRKNGTPKYFLDSQNLTNGEKSDLYDKAIYSEKGRYPKNNPYKNNLVTETPE